MHFRMNMNSTEKEMNCKQVRNSEWQATLCREKHSFPTRDFLKIETFDRFYAGSRR